MIFFDVRQEKSCEVDKLYENLQNQQSHLPHFTVEKSRCFSFIV
jgi:hypothetical protein